MGRKTITEKSYDADQNSATSDALAYALDLVYSNPNVFNQRVLLPKPDNLAEHRLLSADKGAAIQWISGKDNNLIPRYVLNDEQGLKVGPALVTLGKQKLARNDGSNPLRQRLALDLSLLGEGFFKNMNDQQIEHRAGTKYEYVNARGNEAHHILPIGYIGKIMNKLKELGIEGPVVDEMLRRKMSVGDTAQNLASLQTKVKPGRAFLQDQDKSAVVDNHDRVHAMSESLLEDLGLPMQNKGTYRLNDFMDDPNVSQAQKQAYALAVPQAHRLAVQAVQLDPEKIRNQNRLIDSIVRLAADNAQAQMKLSPYSRKLLKGIHGQAF